MMVDEAFVFYFAVRHHCRQFLVDAANQSLRDHTNITNAGQKYRRAPLQLQKPTDKPWI